MSKFTDERDKLEAEMKLIFSYERAYWIVAVVSLVAVIIGLLWYFI